MSDRVRELAAAADDAAEKAGRMSERWKGAGEAFSRLRAGRGGALPQWLEIALTGITEGMWQDLTMAQAASDRAHAAWKTASDQELSAAMLAGSKPRRDQRAAALAARMSRRGDGTRP